MARLAGQIGEAAGRCLHQPREARQPLSLFSLSMLRQCFSRGGFPFGRIFPGRFYPNRVRETLLNL
jgi:hypothetical protein